MDDAQETQGVRLYLYPLWLRKWHWANALLFLLLILTGVSMHYANLDAPFIPFKTARAVHNVCGILLSALYPLFVFGNLFGKNGRHYRPNFKGLSGRLLLQMRYYFLGVFRGDSHPYHSTETEKFNPLQQLTYLGVMYFQMPILIVTGLFLLFPAAAPERVFGAGGIWPMAVIHSIVAFLLTLFMVGHIYLATTGKTVGANFQGMMTGWHEE